MKIIAVNGSPRENGNTYTLLREALAGAGSTGAETTLYQLRGIVFSGCQSCFACKLKGGVSYGRCALRDGLTPMLQDIETADALILGSPNYIGAPTGAMKSFIERLIYPYNVYGKSWSSLFGRGMPTGLIYTMSSNEAWMKEMGYDAYPKFLENVLRLIFGAAETLIVTDTSLFEDYSLYVSDRFDPVHKAEIREKQFPIDCKKAFDMGKRLASRA